MLRRQGAPGDAGGGAAGDAASGVVGAATAGGGVRVALHLPQGDSPPSDRRNRGGQRVGQGEAVRRRPSLRQGPQPPAGRQCHSGATQPRGNFHDHSRANDRQVKLDDCGLLI